MNEQPSYTFGPTEAEILAEYDTLDATAKAAFWGHCPAGRDAQWWIERGWVIQCQEVYSSSSQRIVVSNWKWSRKAEILQAILRSQP
jgi:hypothetical protein